MDSQPPQRFCTTCGQLLMPGAAFCVNCGTQVSVPPMGVPGSFPTEAQPGYLPPNMQAPTQGLDDLLLAGMAVGSRASRRGQRSMRRARRRGSRLRGCGCLLLILVLLIGPLLGVALTNGRLHLIFTYVAVAMVVFILLIILIGMLAMLAMLATRGGREVVAEGCAEGCLDAIFSGFLGGD